MFKKYATSALRGAFASRTRSMLTILGIAMGIFLVVSLLSVGAGVTKQIKEQVDALGSDILTVNTVNTTTASKDSPLTDGLSAPILTLDDLETVKKEPAVSSVTPIRYLGGEVTYNGLSTRPTFIAATTYKYQAVRDVTMKQGRFFTEDEQSAAVPRVAIGTATQRALFGDTNSIGKTIHYNGRALVVVGVMDETDSAPDTVTSNNLDNAVYGPASLVNNVDQEYLYSLIMAKVDPISSIATTKANIEQNIAKYRTKASFKVITEEDRINTSQSILTVITAFVLIIAIISLFISGISVMNSMIIAVTDRTREIGVRKTVGATSMNIFAQFLLEALLVTLLGGVIGLLMAVASILVIAKLAPIEPIISPSLIVLGLSLSLLEGVIFGVGPALSAARKEPILSLQTDRS